MRQNTFGQSVARARARGCAVSHDRAFALELPRTRALPLQRARTSASRTCRPIRRRRDERCAEVYDIQVQGAGAAAVARPGIEQRRDRRLRRTRFDARAAGVRAGDGPCWAAAHATSSPTRCRASPPATRTLDAGAPPDGGGRLHARRRSTSGRAACRCSRTSAIRTPTGKQGLRRHLRERAGRRAHQPSVPARQPARRPRGRHRRPERAGARLVHLRRRRPHVALQRQRERAEDADPAPDPLGRARPARSSVGDDAVLDDILATEISPELVPGDAGGRARAEHRSDRRPVRAAGLPPLLHRCASAIAPPKVAFLAWTAWHDASRATGPTCPTSRATHTRSPRSRSTCGTFLLALLQDEPVQAQRASRTRRRSARAARSRRAATGARRATARRRSGSPAGARPGIRGRGAGSDAAASDPLAARTANPATLAQLGRPRPRRGSGRAGARGARGLTPTAKRGY